MENLSRPLLPGPQFSSEPHTAVTPNIANYEVLVQQLNSMGFSERGITHALESTEKPSIENALSYLLAGEHGYEHPFLPSEMDEKCLICNDFQDLHREHIEEQKDLKAKLIIPLENKQYGVNTTVQQQTANLCEICFEDVENSQYQVPGCSTHTFCISWVTSYLTFKIQNGQVLRLRCPGLRCSVIFPECQIQQLVSDELWKKYTRFKEIERLSEDPDVRWCPTPDWGNFMKGSRVYPHLKCDKCSYEMCFHCSEKWHPGETCEVSVDKAYEKWAKGKEVQLCPQCRRRIEKIEGCNHMTCSWGYEWCWLCRGKYTSRHFNPLNPFGCANLQGQNNTRENFPMSRIFLLRLRSFLLIFLVVLLSPVILVLGPSVIITFNVVLKLYHILPLYIIILITPICFLVWLALTPIGYAIAIPYMLSMLVYKLFLMVYNRASGNEI